MSATQPAPARGAVGSVKQTAGAGYIGRFAPSPTGPLHAGSLVAALASWLDARAHGGRWLVRIEDVDTPRCIPGAAEQMLAQLAACGLRPDAPPLWQSTRNAAYQGALQTLLAAGCAYPCGCTRHDVDVALAAQGQPHQRFAERVYPGTCRDGLHGKPARAVRLCVNPRIDLQTGQRTGHDRADTLITWNDRRLGPQQQHLATAVGDFVLRRADGGWAYQLAVVVDDAAQGITDVVRGQDLADNTARQIHLQCCLGLALPRYLHTPLVLGPDGHKLSKQNGARAIDTADAAAALAALAQAGQHLGLPPISAGAPADWLAGAVAAWADAAGLGACLRTDPATIAATGAASDAANQAASPCTVA